jgi:hypothetical protein
VGGCRTHGCSVVLRGGGWGRREHGVSGREALCCRGRWHRGRVWGASLALLQPDVRRDRRRRPKIHPLHHHALHHACRRGCHRIVRWRERWGWVRRRDERIPVRGEAVEGSAGRARGASQADGGDEDCRQRATAPSRHRAPCPFPLVLLPLVARVRRVAVVMVCVVVPRLRGCLTSGKDRQRPDQRLPCNPAGPRQSRAIAQARRWLGQTPERVWVQGLGTKARRLGRANLV